MSYAVPFFHVNWLKSSVEKFNQSAEKPPRLVLLRVSGRVLFARKEVFLC